MRSLLIGMSTTSLVILSIAAVIVILVVMYFSYNNKEIALRKESEAQRATLIEQLPSTWFVRNKSVIEYTPISTSATKTVMATGVDDYTFSYK